ncbi:MAG TPA: M15 family metallopeptidase [Leptolyngbyaceae cyanobacterium]
MEETAKKPTLVKNVTSCSTAVVKELDQQIIARMNRIIPNVLESFEDFNIQIVGSSVHALLQPAAKEALRKAIKERGKTLSVISAYRTIAQQLILFNHAQAGRCGIKNAARPGQSYHQSGLALNISDASGWEPFLVKYGWRRPLSDVPAHFEFVGGDTHDIRPVAVQAFQELWNLNHSDDEIVVDGVYGPKTEARLGNSPIEGFPKS